MALPASELRARPARRVGAPAVRPALSAPERRPERRRPARGKRLVVALFVLLVVGSLLLVVGARAYLTQGQVRLTRLQDELQYQAGEQSDLQLRVAQLENPTNVLSEGQKQGLVEPASVSDIPQTAPQTAPSSGGR
jgi:Tfp pilus assembly protein PilX